jgi:hypothetical protein
MNKRTSVIVIILLLAVIGLAAGGGSWLWHLFLRMHGMQ